MEELEVEYLKSQIKLVNMDIKAAKSRICGLEYVLKELHEELFYAENGMKMGQPFMFEGERYVRVQGGRIDSYVRAYTAGDSEWRNIYRFDYGGIHPLPMEKSKE